MGKKASGFTLLEVLVTLMILGILAAIASPSWLGFVDRQRVNVANDAIVGAIQEAQREAKRTKQSYSVSFKTEDTEQGKVPKVAIHLADTTPSNWESLGKDLGLQPGQILLGTNLSGENTAAPVLTYASSKPKTITFDYMGTLPRSANLGNKGLIVSVAIPEGSSTQPLTATRRCVKVTTLLGAMQTGKENECNSETGERLRGKG